MRQREVEPDDAVTRYSEFDHDALGNVWSIREYGQTFEAVKMRETAIGYDSNHVLPASVTDAQGHVVNIDYDRGLGMVLRTSDPAVPNGSPIESYSIPDGFGRRRYEVDAAGVRTKLDYVFAGGGNSVRVDVREEGYLSSSGVVVWPKYTNVAHDVHGRPTFRSTSGFGATPLLQELHYDDFGRLERIGRLIKRGRSRVFTSYRYDALDRVTEVVRGTDRNGVPLPEATTEERCYWHNVACVKSPVGRIRCEWLGVRAEPVRSVEPTADSSECLARAQAVSSNPFGYPGTQFTNGPFDRVSQVFTPSGPPSSWQRPPAWGARDAPYNRPRDGNRQLQAGGVPARI